MRVLLILTLTACSGHEAARVALPVVADDSRVLPVQTDLGYTVAVGSARAAIGDVEFTILGEEHESGAVAWLASPSTLAHPGHAAGGEVTGELLGNFLVDFTAGQAPIGTATLLAGVYEGANFSFRRATGADGLGPTDPLLGHTFYLEATATRDAESWTATIVLDLDEGTRLVGAPFAHEVTEGSSETIRLQLVTADPFEADTLFDGVDFAALDEDADGAIAIVPGQTVHNQLRRLFGAHDYYFVEAD